MGLPAVCAVLVIAASRQAWRRVGAVSASGSQLTGGLVDGLGMLGLAGCALLLVTATTGRRLVGILLVLVGVATVVGIGLDSQFSAAEWARHGVATGSGSASPLLAAGWLAVVAAAVMALDGLALAVWAARWPARASRFSRTHDLRPISAEDDPRQVWAAMDRGEDPTAQDPPATSEGRGSN